MDPIHDPDTGIRHVVLTLGPAAEFDLALVKRVVKGMDALGFDMSYFYLCGKDEDVGE